MGASVNPPCTVNHLLTGALTEEEAIDFVFLSFYQRRQTRPSIERGGRTLSQGQRASAHRLRLSLSVNLLPSVYFGSSLHPSPSPLTCRGGRRRAVSVAARFVCFYGSAGKPVKGSRDASH